MGLLMCRLAAVLISIVATATPSTLRAQDDREPPRDATVPRATLRVETIDAERDVPLTDLELRLELGATGGATLVVGGRRIPVDSLLSLVFPARAATPGELQIVLATGDVFWADSVKPAKPAGDDEKPTEDAFPVRLAATGTTAVSVPFEGLRMLLVRRAFASPAALGSRTPHRTCRVPC